MTAAADTADRPRDTGGRVDPRLAFLARAAAREKLVQAGEMTLCDAIEANRRSRP
jgi:hypothetical protein